MSHDREPFDEAFEKLASYPPRMAEELAHRLLDAGVAAQLRPDPLGQGGAGRRQISDPTSGAPRVASRGGYGASIQIHVYVPAPQLTEARAVESRFVCENVPDLPDGFDPQRLAADRCPACETPIGGDANECPECGLHLGN